MGIGYSEANQDTCPYADLDEYLCEYVDGEMDPSVRSVFEEYLRSDGALAEHVDSLRRTREMLSAYSNRGPGVCCGAEARLRSRLSHEVMCTQGPILSAIFGRLGGLFGGATLLLLLISGGILLSESEDDKKPHGIEAVMAAPAAAPLRAAAPQRLTSFSERYAALFHAPAPRWIEALVADTHAAFFAMPQGLLSVSLEPAGK